MLSWNLGGKMSIRDQQLRREVGGNRTGQREESNREANPTGVASLAGSSGADAAHQSTPDRLTPSTPPFQALYAGEWTLGHVALARAALCSRGRPEGTGSWTLCADQVPYKLFHERTSSWCLSINHRDFLLILCTRAERNS